MHTISQNQGLGKNDGDIPIRRIKAALTGLISRSGLYLHGLRYFGAAGVLFLGLLQASARADFGPPAKIESITLSKTFAIKTPMMLSLPASRITSSLQSTVPQSSIPSFPTFKTRKVWVTAYSSSPDETDDTPHITASGTRTRDGIVAANFVPMRTRIQIPELFEDKIFIVEDRMHARKVNGVDVWMPSKREALHFGAAYTEIVILD